jgi:sterol desaturase/sphingolipid hydroxylase (fatty acid hydroxylase superfamily)
MADSTQPEFSFRTAKGEWRPPYPIKFVPLFCWPLRPIAALKWLFGGGYLWPWDLFFMLTATVTWLWLQPPLSRCVEFKVGWISQIYLRNLILLWLVPGGWHLLFYTLKVQGMQRKYYPHWTQVNDRNFLFHNQLYDNIFWSCVSGCTFWTAYEVLYFWAAANHHVPYVSWTEHPVYCAAWLLVIPLWREFHFYWIHRAIHWKPLYKYVHYLHHKNVQPAPWSGLSMHPVEHLLYFSRLLIHWVVPSHPIHFLFQSQDAGAGPANSHLGFEGPVLNGKLPVGSYFHYLHHRYFECNYGDVALPFDRLFGTFRDGLSDVVGASQEPQADVRGGQLGSA